MTNNPWEKFGIKHGSFSNYNTYAANPGLWALKYLFKIPDPAGPKAWLGSAVEAAVEAHNLALGLTKFDAEAKANGGDADDIADARRILEGMFSQANAAMQFLGKGTPEYQHKIEHWIEGMAIPTIGYIDFLYPDLVVDLKTTQAMPSKPKPDHIRQAALYSKATQRPAAVVYATPKKWAVYHISPAEVEEGYRDLVRTALALQNALAAAHDPHEFFARVFTTFDDWRWNDRLIKVAKDLVMEF
jgi:hypothetical protein